jgi:hypothetical protein
MGCAGESLVRNDDIGRESEIYELCDPVSVNESRVRLEMRSTNKGDPVAL